MIVSIAEEMNPTRRNTMEDAHVAHAPGTWGAPDDAAAFLGVYDGHGGRLIAEYLEDRLAGNVASEWEFAESDRGKARIESNGDRREERRRSKKRLVGRENDENCAEDGDGDGDGDRPSARAESDDDGLTVRTALERAFLLSDVQSRLDGITTSGATVACCVVAPQFAPDGRVATIAVHAANAGDGRAVLSSRTARPLRPSSSSRRRTGGRAGGSSVDDGRGASADDDFETRRGPAVRITRDHKSTDADEIARIESSGGIMIRGRVLGVLAVARSIGDHGLKEYVVGRPHLSSTTVRLVEEDGDRPAASHDDCVAGREGRSEVDRPSMAPFTDGEFLIVACDGLWDVMEDQEAVNLVRGRVWVDENAARDTEEQVVGREGAASLLVDEAMRRGTTDNVTVIVYWL